MIPHNRCRQSRDNAFKITTQSGENMATRNFPDSLDILYEGKMPYTNIYLTQWLKAHGSANWIASVRFPGPSLRNRPLKIRDCATIAAKKRTFPGNQRSHYLRKFPIIWRTALYEMSRRVKTPVTRKSFRRIPSI